MSGFIERERERRKRRAQRGYDRAIETLDEILENLKDEDA